MSIRLFVQSLLPETMLLIPSLQKMNGLCKFHHEIHIIKIFLFKSAECPGFAGSDMFIENSHCFSCSLISKSTVFKLTIETFVCT